MPTLKLSQKAVLLVVAPLCIVLIFLTMLLGQLKELEIDSELAAKSSKVMTAFDVLLSHAINSMTAWFQFNQSNNDLKKWNEFKKGLGQISEDRETVRQLSVEVPSATNDINQIVSMIDDVMYSFGEGRHVEDTDEIAKRRITGKVVEQFSKINAAGQALLAAQNTRRAAYIERNVQSSEQLRILIEIFAAAIFIGAIAASIILAITFNRRLDTLMKNTISIATGAPLESPIGGSDELSTFDEAIHRLSFELSQARSREHALVENAAEIICSLDPHFRFSQVNAAVQKVLGYNQDEILGMLVQSLVLKEDQQATFAALETCKSSESEVAFESRLIRKDKRVIDTTWMARWSERDKNIFCILHDITERKHAERLRQNVLTMVSHDIRSPLMSVAVTMEMLSTGALGDLTDKGTAMVARTNNSINTLMVMLNDLLELEKLQFKEFDLNYKSENISALLRASADMVMPEAEKKHIQLEIDSVDVTARVDRDRLRRVIVNMLGNAIKFSPADSIIKLTAQIIDSGWVEIKVVDQGPGISPEKVDIVFDKFKQVNSDVETEKSGSGLGLAICKAIVEAHNGTIGVLSILGHGTTFWFRVPLDQ